MPAHLMLVDNPALMAALADVPRLLALVGPAALYAGRHRLVEPVIAGPGGVDLGYELDLRGGNNGRPEKRRDARKKARPRRWAEARINPVFRKGLRIHLLDMMRHVQVIGPTGQGKTTVLVSMAYQNLKEGLGVFVLETGGDFAEQIVPYARKLGRPVFDFDTSDPGSWKWNPLEGDPIRSAERVATAMIAAVGAKHEYFKNHNEMMLRAMVLAAHAWSAKTGKPATLETVMRIADDDEFRRRAIDAHEEEPPKGARKGETGKIKVNSQHLPDFAKTFWQDRFYGTMSKAEKEDYTGGMKNAISKLLMRPEVAALLCPTGEEGEKILKLKEALETGGLVVMRMPLGETGDETAQALSVWAMHVFQAVVLERSRHTAHPMMAYFDEVHNTLGLEMSVGAEKFGRFVTQARHYNVGIVCSYQGYALVPEALRPIFAINLRTKLIAGGLDPEAAEIAQKVLSGDPIKVKSQTRSTGGGRFSRSESVKVEELYRWSLDEIMSVPLGQWLCVRVKDGLTQYPVLIQAKRAPKLRALDRRADLARRCRVTGRNLRRFSDRALDRSPLRKATREVTPAGTPAGTGGKPRSSHRKRRRRTGGRARGERS